MPVINILLGRKKSDAAFVEGIYNRDEKMARELHYYCKQYFDQKYGSIFFADNKRKDEIFHESFLALWKIIVDRKVYVEDGELRGRGNKPFSGKLTTLLMSIAKYKYLELVRDKSHINDIDIDELLKKKYNENNDLISTDDTDDIMYNIIDDCLSNMPKGCYKILTMFYYEEKSLETIMTEIDTYESKNALKTAKYKCLTNLRNSANAIYHSYLNA